MAFTLPLYHPPDFKHPPFLEAPLAAFKPAPKAGVAPDDYHATSIFPEYFQIQAGEWRLLKESRMDCVVVLEKDQSLSVKEFRHLKKTDQVACGRRENGEEGIFVHAGAFHFPQHVREKFGFRMRLSRETSFSVDYDELYDLLTYEKDMGTIVWVLGPAVAFDRDAREAFVWMVESGYVHGFLAGNALAVHDVEGAMFGTGLGQDIYTKKHAPLGHYKHLDALNAIHDAGSMEKAIQAGLIKDGIMRAVIETRIPYVLAGSIRDDGPLPEVICDTRTAQDRMRDILRQATTIIAMATQLHAIATGNMVPSYKVTGENLVRPVYFYTVDMSEFAVNKLTNRGSLTAHSILTNVQDFIVTAKRGLDPRCK